jgi:hypothetical protein
MDEIIDKARLGEEERVRDRERLARIKALADAGRSDGAL